MLGLVAAGALFIVSPSDLSRLELPTVSAKGKAKKPKHGPAAAQIAKLLESQGQGVMQCAVKQALDNGATKVDCVDALIRSLKFPASDAPLTTVQRDWAIS